MRNKKVKAIRKLVKDLPVSEDTKYKPYAMTRHHTKVGEDGVVSTVKVDKGTPRVMDVCRRSVVKGMK